MESNKLKELLVKHLEDKLALNIVTIDMQEKSPFVDYFIICEGKNDKHIQALASEIVDYGEEIGITIKSKNIYENSDWYYVDLGDVVVHIFSNSARLKYNLEDLWK